MLDDAQPQSGTTHFFGVAFVHPVEPFEDPFHLVLRDADAIVPNLQLNIVRCFGNRQPHISTGAVILDSVICQIEHDAGNQLGYGSKTDRVSCQCQADSG